MPDNLATRYQQVADSIVDINGVVTRIDERLDNFIDKLNSLEKKIDHHIETCPAKCYYPEILTRVKMIEDRSSNGALKQEIKEIIKEQTQEFKSRFNELKEDINALETEVDIIKMSTKDLSFLANKSEGKWRTVGWLVLNVAAPLLYIIIGALVLRWWGLQSPNVP